MFDAHSIQKFQTEDENLYFYKIFNFKRSILFSIYQSSLWYIEANKDSKNFL